MTAGRDHEYVDYGGLATCPAPFACLDATMQGFFLEADHERLHALCTRVFTAPTRGRIEVEPVGAHVMVNYGSMPHICPQHGPASRMGSVPEKQAGIWVPVLVKDRGGPGRGSESLAFFIPYIWVDNPISLAGGREIYGYPKNLGWIDLPRPEAPHHFALDAYGGNFGAGMQAGRHRLIEIEAAHHTVSDSPWQSLEHALDPLRTIVRDGAAGILAPGLGLPERLFDALVERQALPQVFLKQFRSARDGARASFQQVIEAPIRITRLGGGPLPGAHTVTVHHLDSHPVGEQLGLQSQTATRGFHVEMDCVLEEGAVLWDAHVAAALQAQTGGDLEWLAAVIRGGLALRPGLRTLLAPARAGVDLLTALADALRGPQPQPPKPAASGSRARLPVAEPAMELRGRAVAKAPEPAAEKLVEGPTSS